MSEQQIKAMVIMNIIDNCTMELDNTGQERYSLDEQQFGKCVDTLVKNINVIHCCMSEAEQLVCDHPKRQRDYYSAETFKCWKCKKIVVAN